MKHLNFKLVLTCYYSFFILNCQSAKSLSSIAVSDKDRTPSSENSTSLPTTQEPLLETKGVSCSITYAKGYNGVFEDSFRVGQTFCPVGYAGQKCDTHFLSSVSCNTESPTWYQDAIDQAAKYSRDKNKKTTVYLTRGDIEITHLLNADWPFGSYVGVHLPSFVDLAGSPADYGETRVRFAFEKQLVDARNPQISLKQPEIRSVILVSANRSNASGSLFESTQGNRILNMTLGGSKVRNYLCESINKQDIAVYSGILVGAVKAELDISNVKLRHFVGNAIELGLFMQWVSEEENCKNDLACLAKRLKVQGNSKEPVLVHKNDICDALFGGIVVIGNHVVIEKNMIRKIDKTWDTQQNGFGLSMGISAAFAGSADITVRNNQIEGADYSIGTDGSFPLYVSINLFKKYWEDIKKSLGEKFSNKYPDVPLDATGNLNFKDNDFVLAQQILFDKASKEAISRQDESGFNSNLRVYNNELVNAIVGVSLYRVKDSLIYQNKINSKDSTSLYGIDINQSYSNYIYNNEIIDWKVGVRIYGKPNSMSVKGSSYNGIGVVPPYASSNQVWSTNGNKITGSKQWSIQIDNAGFDNSIRANNVDRACSIKGALRQQPEIDWLTDNSHISCNGNY